MYMFVYFSARGAAAAEKAKVLEEYLARKREAAIYKARAQGQGVSGWEICVLVWKPVVPYADILIDCGQLMKMSGGWFNI